MIPAMAFLFGLSATTAVWAQEQAVSEVPAVSEETPEATASVADASTADDNDTPAVMRGRCMMHQGKGHQHGQGHGGMKHGSGHGGKGRHDKHAQVLQRLDLMEARLAKIEAMLEGLMRR